MSVNPLIQGENAVLPLKIPNKISPAKITICQQACMNNTRVYLYVQRLVCAGI